MASGPPAFESYAGDYIQAIGPQYGTVSPQFVKKAAREAMHAEGVDLLCVLGFAFDAQVTGVTEEDGATAEATDEGFANVRPPAGWGVFRCSWSG